ncbi:hypothetical protein SAMN04489760_10395 [Syntrophus gentianae]|uniref:Uncharacterized protein n=1 Tax=Syntrophus gentianae TaxID=43775 RepID=A0A1H7V8C0_9BACT|nr:hypothetical protein [Syntrophus gentianae]SEM05491.1 hypothetical protein SAMN04489760_10395 [Syntrophus gentianae]
MEKLKEAKSGIEQAAEDLFNFAVDREDVKALMAYLHEAADIKRNSVEYELQILKIISVGWAIPYCLENAPQKDLISAYYWRAIQNFSQSLSETFGLMVGHSIDYFQVLKDRLDTYVSALQQQSDAPEPAVVIGPEFAKACGNRDDVFTVMTGSRMFLATIASVKQYLETVNLSDQIVCH